MKRTVLSQIAVAVCTCALIAGCAKAPLQETAAAQAALESAKAAKADIFSAEQYNAAQAMVTAALSDVKAQSAKSPFSRNYEKAKKMLVDAAKAAEAAKASVAANKAKVVEETKSLLDKAHTAVAESKKLVEGLIKKKNKDAAALKTKLETAAAALPADLGKVAEDALIATRDAINSVIATAESIKVSVEQLKAAPKSKKK
jgi:colicin import membrane protein